MKSDTEILESYSNKTIYENREYYGMVLGRLIFRTVLIAASSIPFLLLMYDIVVETVKISSHIGAIVLLSIVGFSLFFLYYFVIYRWTYRNVFIKTPKRVIVDGETIYVETAKNTYKIDLDEVEMLGRAPYWHIKMKDGTIYEFYGVHHSITDPILETWKKMHL